jgi:hypothetical protein
METNDVGVAPHRRSSGFLFICLLNDRFHEATYLT